MYIVSFFLVPPPFFSPRERGGRGGGDIYFKQILDFRLVENGWLERYCLFVINVRKCMPKSFFTNVSNKYTCVVTSWLRMTKCPRDKLMLVKIVLVFIMFCCFPTFCKGIPLLQCVTSIVLFGHSSLYEVLEW